MIPETIAARSRRPEEALGYLGELLSAKRSRILERWTARVHREQAPDGLSRGELWDHLPRILDELLAALAPPSAAGASPLPAESPASVRHGEQRLRVGFDVREVVREYGILMDCLLEEVEAAGERLSVPEVRLIGACVNTGIAEAVRAYVDRRDAELRRHSGRHVAFVAHELRNPLNSARLAAAAVRSLRTDDRLLDIVDRNLGRLGQLIDQALTADRLEDLTELAREPCDVGALVREAVDDALGTSESRDVKLSVDVEAGLRYEGDARLLRSTFGNVIGNAVKFTRPGGAVRIAARRASGELVLTVEDACGGLPEGDPSDLFEPFVQRGDRRTGFGLGLAIVRQAVSAHGGRVEVTNVPGDGCTFAIHLPLAPPAGPGPSGP
jgi:signal transduction histidine kinase